MEGSILFQKAIDGFLEEKIHLITGGKIFLALLYF
jgi:hypothetical protein